MPKFMNNTDVATKNLHIAMEKLRRQIYRDFNPNPKPPKRKINWIAVAVIIAVCLWVWALFL